MESKIGKVGKPENSQTDEERKCQNDEKVCKAILKGLQDAIEEVALGKSQNMSTRM